MLGACIWHCSSFKFFELGDSSLRCEILCGLETVNPRHQGQLINNCRLATLVLFVHKALESTLEIMQPLFFAHLFRFSGLLLGKITRGLCSFEAQVLPTYQKATIAISSAISSSQLCMTLELEAKLEFNKANIVPNCILPRFFAVNFKQVLVQCVVKSHFSTSQCFVYFAYYE